MSARDAISTITTLHHIAEGEVVRGAEGVEAAETTGSVAMTGTEIETAIVDSLKTLEVEGGEAVEDTAAAAAIAMDRAPRTMEDLEDLLVPHLLHRMVCPLPYALLSNMDSPLLHHLLPLP